MVWVDVSDLKFLKAIRRFHDCVIPRSYWLLSSRVSMDLHLEALNYNPYPGHIISCLLRRCGNHAVSGMDY
jgi:hypothetical protein